METEAGPVTQVRSMWYALTALVAKDTILKARVDDVLADEVDRWAEAHDVDRSEAIRIALRRLLEDEEERRERIKAARERIDELAGTGIFEAPEDDSWKASGGW